MIALKQAQINWTAIGVIVAIIFGIVGIIGWFVVHSLTKRREKLQRREKILREISDFEVVINQCVKAINDTHVPRNQIWGVTLSGGLDFYARALNDVRAQSIGEMDNYMRAIRARLNADNRTRFDSAWQDYQNYNIEGIDEKDPATGQEFTSHIHCKKDLISCLEKIKKIANEIEI